MQNYYNQLKKPDFDLARIRAYQLLIQQDRPRLGMNAERIIMPGKKIIFDTLQNYCHITGKCMGEITSNGKIKLGCHLNINNGLAYIILNNEDIYSFNCENWTKIHEIGHVCLNHNNDADKEEVEANFFTACFTMPDAIIKYFMDRGYEVNEQFLTQYFKVSPDAASRKLISLKSYIPTTNYDNQIIGLLWRDINIIKRDIELSEQLNYIYAL